MKLLHLVAVAACAVALSGCASSAALTDLTAHLNERNCATKGSATASAGLTGPSLSGHLEWDCAGAPPAVPEPPT